MSRKKRTKRPTIDESIERRPVTERDFKDAFRMLLSTVVNRPRSENRQPSKVELEQRYRLDRDPE